MKWWWSKIIRKLKCSSYKRGGDGSRSYDSKKVPSIETKWLWSKMTAKNVLVSNWVGMEPNHSTAKKFLARNKVGMKPNHMTAKKVLARNEVKMEPNHTIKQKQAKAAMEKIKNGTQKESKKLEVQYCMSPFYYLKIHEVHSSVFYLIWTTD